MAPATRPRHAPIPKSQRIQARATADEADVIARAASLVNATVSAFVLDAAIQKAASGYAHAPCATRSKAVLGRACLSARATSTSTSSASTPSRRMTPTAKTCRALPHRSRPDPWRGRRGTHRSVCLRTYLVSAEALASAEKPWTRRLTYRFSMLSFFEYIDQR